MPINPSANNDSSHSEHWWRQRSSHHKHHHHHHPVTSRSLPLAFPARSPYHPISHVAQTARVYQQFYSKCSIGSGRRPNKNSRQPTYRLDACRSHSPHSGL